jgi:hypothetical protein
MRKVLGLLTVALVLIGCEGPEKTTTPRPSNQYPAKPHATVNNPTWLPNPNEYYESDYPPTPDSDGEFDDPLEGPAYLCPSRIAGIEVPGNVPPFHKVKIGNFASQLRRISIIGYSTSGIPKGRYLVPPGPWVSQDGQLAVLGGTVDGYCIFWKIPHYDIAGGTLRVYMTDLDVIGPVGGGSTGTSPCEYSEILYDPYGGHTVTCPAPGSGGGGGVGGGSADDCTWEYITIEIDYGDGHGWQTYWEGWGWWCDQT